MKPTDLIRYLVMLITPPDGVILDPFMGSGTTLRVALDLGHPAIGIDSDPHACEIAAERLSQKVLDFQAPVSRATPAQEKKMPEMSVLGKEGDTKLIWDSGNEIEAVNARRTFDEMRGKGFLAFSVEGADYRKGEVLHAFDSKAQRIILTPPIAGG